MLLSMSAGSKTPGFAQEDQMKKKLLAGLVTGLLMVGIAGAGNATPFSDLRDFDEIAGVGDFAGITYNEIENNYKYTHTLLGLTSPAYILQDATLSLRHNGNSNNSGELWFSSADAVSDILIGQLTGSGTAHDWTIDTWTLSAEILDLMDDGDPWALTVNLYDTTSGLDRLKIDYSILAGNYVASEDPNPAPVPEPTTLLMMGTGLAGLVCARKKKKP
jgi:hypothetical protein